jgi:hypothetical protein
MPAKSTEESIGADQGNAFDLRQRRRHTIKAIAMTAGKSKPAMRACSMLMGSGTKSFCSTLDAKSAAIGTASSLFGPIVNEFRVWPLRAGEPRSGP